MRKYVVFVEARHSKKEVKIFKLFDSLVYLKKPSNTFILFYFIYFFKIADMVTGL